MAAERTRVTGSERAAISSRRSVGSSDDDKDDVGGAMSIVVLGEIASDAAVGSSVDDEDKDDVGGTMSVVGLDEIPGLGRRQQLYR